MPLSPPSMKQVMTSLSVRVLRWCSSLIIATAIVLISVSPVSAHTEFESSSPADGQTVDGPVSEISITFLGEASPAGEGFAILTPDGTIRMPDETLSLDNLTWTLRFDEALTEGDIGVRWTVAAPDTHPIDGSFSFTIVPPSPVTTVPPTAASPDSSVSQAGARQPVELEDFLASERSNAPGGDVIAAASRLFRLLGTVVSIGGLMFAMFVLRSTSRDTRAVLFWVRRGGVLLVIGAIASVVAQLVAADGSWSGLWSFSRFGDVLWNSAGLAIGLRFVAGLLIVLGVRMAGVPSMAPRLAKSSNSSASKNLVALVGIALLALSYSFDGHTVSEGPRWAHALANLVHVVAGATWAGGVVMLWFVIASRRRRGAPNKSMELGVRFSVVATVALVAAAIAGTVLSVIILDSVSDIWNTSWGNLLLLKVLLVGVAAAGGGYNHRVIVPGLENAPHDPSLTARFRTVVTVEAAALLLVTAVTAFLIAASAV